MDLRKFVRDIPDWPKKGIIFKDITPLLEDAAAFRYTIDRLYDHYKDQKIESVVAIDARGFILGAPLAYRLGVGIIPARKKGKLPAATHDVEYELEYGTATLSVHQDAVAQGERVLVVDDLLATGGTTAAVCQILEKVGAEIVGIAYLIELSFLNGRQKLKDYPIFRLIDYQ